MTPDMPLYLTPLPYLLGMVFLWIIGAVVLALAPGAREEVGPAILWVALGWPITIPLGVLLAYIEWLREVRQDREAARRTRMGSATPPTLPAKW